MCISLMRISLIIVVRGVYLLHNHLYEVPSSQLRLLHIIRHVEIAKLELDQTQNIKSNQ